MKHLLCLLPVSALLLAAPAAEPEWTPLLSGDTITGFTPTPGGTWTLKDGVLNGTSPQSEKRHSILLSDAEYADFEIAFDFKVTQGNSGFYFRVKKVDHPVAVKGFQAEVDQSMKTGFLYETLGRRWVVKPDLSVLEGKYTPGEWASMRVRCQGKSVDVFVNGVATQQLRNDPGNTEGHLGFQLHGGQDMDVSFKRIRMRKLSKMESFVVGQEDPV